MSDFCEWLSEEIHRRGWSQAELARRAEVTPAQISRVLSKVQQPGPDTCTGIAQALGISPEEVFRRAGRLPPEPPEAVGEKKLLRLFRQLSQGARQEVLEYLAFRYEHEKGEPTTLPTTTESPALASGEQQVTMQTLMTMLATRSYSEELELDEGAQEALARLLLDIAELARKLDHQEGDTNGGKTQG